MRSVVIPGLGGRLRGWRESQGCSQWQWAVRLWRNGCHMGPSAMARTLAHAEQTDEWRAADPIPSLGMFQASSKRALVRSPRDETVFYEIADVIKDGLIAALESGIS